MGLDISAYRKIQKIDCYVNENSEPCDRFTHDVLDYDFRAYSNPDFPGRADGVECGAFYHGDCGASFGAGSYSGYNRFRNELAALAGYPAKSSDHHGLGSITMRHDQGAWEADSGPFWELINFSDCEGTIGAKVCSKLSVDFAAFQEKADYHPDEYFRRKYAEWREAFDCGADDGAVDFH